MALLAAGAAGAFWTEAGGGTALYAPTKTKEADQHHDITHTALVQLYGATVGLLLCSAWRPLSIHNGKQNTHTCFCFFAGWSLVFR